MYTRRSFLLVVVASGLAFGQDAQVSFQITGDVKQPVTLTADDLAKMPRASVRTSSNGMETVYDGV